VLNLNRIVVFVDLSPASAAALRSAHALARASHAALDVLRVVTEPLAADWTSEVAAAGLPAVHGAMEDEVREWLAGVMGEVEAQGVGLDVETGDPAGEIVRYVNVQGPDLLVLSAPGGDDETAGIAQAVVADAVCAVLVVRAGQ
jgi:hypothetical protein